MFQNISQIVKNKLSLVDKQINDSKWRRMVLSCSKKAISIIERNKV